MSDLREFLGEHFDMVSDEKLAWRTAKNQKPEVVAERHCELANAAWRRCESRVNVIAKRGIGAWHAGRTPKQVRALYRKAASEYYGILQAIDIKAPVEHLLYARGQNENEARKQVGKAFVRMQKDRFGEEYIVYLDRIQPYAYDAERALACAMIAQDWSLAESLAREVPVPLSTRARPTMSASLLRYTMLGRARQVEQRLKVWSPRPEGVDSPPRHQDFALGIVRQDEKLVARALKSTISSFRRKWKPQQYLTKRMLARYGGSREKLLRATFHHLKGSWLYSYWAVAMMALAAREGMTIHTDPCRFSDFVPHDLCVPATRSR